jgi:anti-sigma B factor antagonist
MIINMEPRELSPDVSAIIFTGRFVLGNRLGEVEHNIRQRIDQGLKKLVLDFSGLDFIDSSGIGVLAMSIGLMEQAGGKLVFVCAPGQVRQLMKLTHLDQAVEIYPDLLSAQSALSGPPTTPPPA